MQIIDNYLEPTMYKNISDFLKSNKTNWFLSSFDTQNFTNNKNGFFEHFFYDNNQPSCPKFFDLILPILKKLKVTAPIKVRANLSLRDIDTVESGWHMDGYHSAATTGILYFTSCNGKTVVKTKDGDVFVDSVENRMLLFPQKTEHKIVYQTDVHERYLINFNFFGELCQ